MDNLLPNRQSQRLSGYDYSSAGMYFVTICTHQKLCLLGSVIGEEFASSQIGEIVAECWMELPEHFPSLVLDNWVVMPNHIHGILSIEWKPRPVGATHASPAESNMGSHASPASIPQAARPCGPAPKSLSAIVGSFKSAATRRVRQVTGRQNLLLWQRGFHDHIIRHQKALDSIRWYIQTNPENWHKDENFVS